MVIEYIGSIIRNEVANRREQIYEKQVSFIFLLCTKQTQVPPTNSFQICIRVGWQGWVFCLRDFY